MGKPKKLTAEEWDACHDSVDEFQRNWAFDRKESGLGVLLGQEGA